MVPSVDGAQLRAVRVAARLTLEQVARRTGYSAAHLSNVEAGRRAATAKVAEAYERVVIGEREQLGIPWDSSSAVDVLAHASRAAVVDRRQFMIFSGATLAAMVPTAPVLTDAAADGDLVACLNARTETLWHLDDLLGGGACLPAAVGDLRMVSDALKHSPSSGLFAAAASLGRFAGFAAFDAGQHAAAQRFWHAALRSAHAANDSDQTVYILSNLALQDIYVNHGREALDLLSAARSRVDPASRTVLSMLDCWAARAHAIRGERRQAAMTLNRADDLWGNRKSEDDPPWIYWMPQPSLTAEAATAMLNLGQPGTAIQMLQDGMADLPSDAQRERNLYLARFAQAALARHEWDEARAAIEAAAAGISHVDSARVVSLVDDLLQQVPRRS
jgi:transcriptional regulator with XRE-family HTH domain